MAAGTGSAVGMGQWVQIFFYVGLMFYVFLLPAAVFRCHFMAEVCCSVLQFVAVCCSVLQCVAVCCMAVFLRVPDVVYVSSPFCRLPLPLFGGGV